MLMTLPDVSCSLSFHVVVHHQCLHAAVEVNRTEAATSGKIMYRKRHHETTFSLTQTY